MTEGLPDGGLLVQRALVETSFLVETHIFNWQPPKLFTVRDPGRMRHETVVLLDPFLDLQVGCQLTLHNVQVEWRLLQTGACAAATSGVGTWAQKLFHGRRPIAIG
jgi:hypothetical protein